MNRYNNYHKHDHISSIALPDTNTHMSDYVNRAIELSEPNIWTTNHGTMGDIFEARSLCDSNGLNCKAGLEGYIVKNPLEKDASNYHIVVIPKTNIARKKLNKANSRANKEGYYYRPRLFIEDLLEKFDDNELFITTACVAGLLKNEDSINNIFYPLYEKFGKNIFLEVQNHPQEIQLETNRKAIGLSSNLGLYMIAANDSHYIYPEQSKERAELLRGKGLKYSDEDAFILDYPDYDTLCDRFNKQGLFTKSQIVDIIDQTLVLDECENIDINKSIKMPTIDMNLTSDEKIEKLRHIVYDEFGNVVKTDDITDDMIPVYKEDIEKELKVVEETKEINTADYFLLNYKLVDLAVNKYGGVLTRGGRGSCGGFLLNKILGITQIDKRTVNLPIYSERFASSARLLENHALPDIDYNVASQEPFVKASKELLGENGCYPMVAYGTMKLSEAFRNVCRSHDLPFDEFNEVGKNVELYENDPYWKPYIDEAKKYIGTIISASVHSCAHLLSNYDIEEEIGIVKIGDFYCALITSSEADEWKYLKNDYLIVTVWDIIDKVFKEINEPIMTVKELRSKIDDRVWKLFEDGMTATLNQCDGDWATKLLKEYKPRTIEELSMFVGSIRPSFSSFRDGYIAREEYTTGSKELDKLFEKTGHYVIFQENLMQYFEWLGVTPAESIGLIKKISKKKIKPQDFEKLTDRLRDGWVRNVGDDSQFDDMWGKMQSMMGYGFNAPHGLATALDCLYCAYLKVNYPLQYYTVTLNIYANDAGKTNRLVDEAKYFGIKFSNPFFRHSTSFYSYDTSTNTIYKGLRSIKNIGKNNGEELYELKDNKYNDFIDCLTDISKTSVNSRQLDILICLDFFKEFGNPNQLLEYVEIFNTYSGKKIIRKDSINPQHLPYIIQFSRTSTDKQFRDIDTLGLIKAICSTINTTTSQEELAAYQSQLLGMCDVRVVGSPYCVVTSVEINNYGTPYVGLYCLHSGNTMVFKADKKFFADNSLDVGDIVKIALRDKPKRKKIDNKWVQDGTERTLVAWSLK